MLKLDATDTAGVLSIVEQLENPPTAELADAEEAMRPLLGRVFDTGDYWERAGTVGITMNPHAASAYIAALAEALDTACGLLGISRSADEDLLPDIPPWGTGTSLTDGGDD